MGDYYTVTVKRSHDEVVVAAAGEIDLDAQSRLGEVIDGAIDGGGRLVVDLSAVSFIDSSGLAVLLRAHRAQRDAGAAMVVRAPSAQVLSVLEMTGMCDTFTFEAADGG